MLADPKYAAFLVLSVPEEHNGIQATAVMGPQQMLGGLCQLLCQLPGGSGPVTQLLWDSGTCKKGNENVGFSLGTRKEQPVRTF